MTSREIVLRTIEFRRPERLARSFGLTGESDLSWAHPDPKPDGSFRSGTDAWGVKWENIDDTRGGQVHTVYIEDWGDLSGFTFPDPDALDWTPVYKARAENPDLFMIGSGSTLYSRLHYLRGQENTWTDIYLNPEALCAFIDRLADLSVALVERYADAGFDGYMIFDDWGLQDRLMISPAKWREIWKPRYARIFGAARRRGLKSLMHSCGYIIDILPDLIEIGLDVIQQDQQQNMGLENLGKYAGQITFYCPVDIQNTMARGNLDEIAAYCSKLVTTLGVPPQGGFLPMQYGDYIGGGHTKEAVLTMIEAFKRVSAELYGK